ncbi:cupredoxin domain-containing protein [Noviherbaspirillum sp. ST9]|uniref:cupredoxin domain-containing protein n=1 Tax=Noviherbaspirillum sp. ST9 TaxID=3401606 RepID=UPI003B588504
MDCANALKTSSRWHLILATFLAGMSMMASAASKPAVHTVIIDGMQFSPATLEINAGDTVIWKNKDPFPHTATSLDKPGFDSGEIRTGGSWRYVAKKRGSFPYDCTLHRTMRGVLIIK